MFYNYNKILSYNALINILIGERGVGKTFGASEMVIKDYLKNDNQFAYIRRYKTELKKSVPNFFDALNQKNKFKEHNLSTKR